MDNVIGNIHSSKSSATLIYLIDVAWHTSSICYPAGRKYFYCVRVAYDVIQIQKCLRINIFFGFMLEKRCMQTSKHISYLQHIIFRVNA